MRTVVLVLAAALIAAAVALILRPARTVGAPEGAGPRPSGRRAAMELVWALVPVAFVALLVALSAAR